VGKTAAPGAKSLQLRLSSAHRVTRENSRDALGLLMGQAKIALECVECRKEAGEIAPGWQAYLVSDPDIEGDEEIVVYCPDCARREFGPVESWV
jgi:hypothetical protein